jgi:hypothetical protein
MPRARTAEFIFRAMRCISASTERDMVDNASDVSLKHDLAPLDSRIVVYENFFIFLHELYISVE